MTRRDQDPPPPCSSHGRADASQEARGESGRGPPARFFLAGAAATASALAVPGGQARAPPAEPKDPRLVSLALKVNGRDLALEVPASTTLLELLRERSGLTGTKKGCDAGACGSCTVLADGKTILSCLTLAAAVQGREITTIEGLAPEGELHPMQRAFLEHDAYQCGFCTPGQGLSGVACVAEGHAGSKQEIQAWMSGNLCRCGAYPNIVEAVSEVAKKGGKA
mgnify:CR=1 FL=1